MLLFLEDSTYDFLFGSNFPDEFVSDADGLQACYCPDPCFETEYVSKVSTYKFPSGMFLPPVTLNQSKLFINFTAFWFLWSHLLSHLSKILQHLLGDPEWYAANFVVVNIFFGKMSFQEMKERKAYTVLEMIGEYYSHIAGLSLSYYYHAHIIL